MDGEGQHAAPGGGVEARPRAAFHRVRLVCIALLCSLLPLLRLYSLCDVRLDIQPSISEAKDAYDNVEKWARTEKAYVTFVYQRYAS